MKIKSKRQRVRKTILIITFLIFPAIFFYFSPYLVIEGTLEGVVSGSFIMFVLMFISSLFLGRAYCGWVCPGSEIQDQIAKINNNKIKKGNFIKWLIWLPWISIIIILAIQNGGYHSIDPFYRTVYGLSIINVETLFVYLIVLSLIIFPAFLIGTRSFCHHICWMAPFMIIGRKIRNFLQLPSLQLVTNPNECKSCHICTENCPMSLPVEDMAKKGKMENTDCILCGNCVDNCKGNIIKFEFNKIRKN